MQDIKRALGQSIHLLVRDLAPGGYENGGYYFPRNPRRDDRKPGSFWIRVTADAPGVWQDHAIMSEPKDLLELVRYLADLQNMREVRQWCLNWLGWGDGKGPRFTAADRKRREEENARRIAQEKAKTKATNAENAKKAKGWWLSAKPEIVGTVAEAYLAGRGIDLSQFPKEPGALRFSPQEDHISADGEVTVWPCLMAGMSDPRGQIACLHRTWLKPDGSGKAPVDAPKKMWPSPTGCMIRISKGETGKSPELCAKQGLSGKLLVTEGIEDGLSIAQAMPELRVWAAGSVANFGHIPKLPCVSQLIVNADNDEHRQAVEAFENVRRKLVKRFGDVRVVRVFKGKDANDLLRMQSHGNYEETAQA